MNGRTTDEKTPVKRLAAVFRSLHIQRERPAQAVPDYADIEEILGPFLDKELLIARIDQASKPSDPDSQYEMVRKLAEVEKVIRGMNPHKLAGPEPGKRPGDRAL